MGWSLQGILAGAGAGISDWAVKGMEADRTAARDASLAAKQAERDAIRVAADRETQILGDKLLGERAASTAELKRAMDEKEETRKRGLETKAMADANALVTAGGVKPGTAEYNRQMGDALTSSGFEALGGKYIASSYKDKELTLKEQEIELRKGANAAAVGATNEARAARMALAGSESERKSLERLDKNFIETTKLYTVVDPDNPGKAKTDAQLVITAATLVDKREAALLGAALAKREARIEAGEKNVPKPDIVEIRKEAVEYGTAMLSKVGDPKYKGAASTSEKLMAAAQDNFNATTAARAAAAAPKAPAAAPLAQAPASAPAASKGPGLLEQTKLNPPNINFSRPETKAMSGLN